jgi:triosephosphate isomerase
MKYIIGNWKSNFGEKDISIWFEKLSQYLNKNKTEFTNLIIVICPPFLYLPQVANLISKHKLPIHIGAQNISAYQNGAYTGEVNAQQIKEYASYVLIGHSERRKYLQENDNQLNEKVKRATEMGICPVYCISELGNNIPQEVTIVAYEPIFAIGTGKADTSVNANCIAEKIKALDSNRKVIYGGSVNQYNIDDFLKESNIDGVLPGKTSLDPQIFGEMLINASKT